MRRYLFLLAIFVCFDALSAPVKLMVEDSWPPFAFREKDRAVGMSVDIVRAAFKQVGESIELVQVPYPRCLAQTQSGKFPACFNSAHSREMDADFLFPKEPLFKSKGLIVALRTGTAVKAQKVKDLEGQSVALPNGFPFGVEFDENTKIKKVFTANDLTSLMMLNSRRVGFVAIDEYVFYYYLKNKPEFRDRFKVIVEMSEEPIYVHFSRKHADAKVLLKKFEVGLAMLKASSGYKSILENWVGPEGQRSVNVTSVVE
ncbi:substrate-binding periplasmic protein [Bdellovibrio bacteriovorus]|uniref:substrate-binding periplasmic protein n=1 Tax=Bdellovibrio bacteriovorus TaxID=959 RepID=UPI0035A62094